MSRNQVIHTADEIARIRRAAQLTAQVRDSVAKLAKPGITTFDLDQLAGELIRETGGKSAFLGYRGYPGNICISVNDEVIHGIPGSRVIREGDVVSIDVGAYYKGYHGDNAFTFAAGSIAPEVQQLLDATQEGLRRAIQAAVPGARIGDISWAVQSYVEQFGYGVVKEYVGHGVGRELHEEPEVPNYGRPGHGVRLVPGMVIAIEPMVNMGTAAVRVLKDKWTVVTQDGKPSAHFENTIAITENGPVILTKA